MSFREEHELHGRRKSRNIGVGITLAIFIAIVFGLTVVKVSNMGAVPQASQIGGN